MRRSSVGSCVAAVFAQVKTEEKSRGNEVPTDNGGTGTFGGVCAERRHHHDRCVRNAVSAGCQYAAADKIVTAGADYLFSLKGNQETLHDDVEEYFKGIDFQHPESGAEVHETFDVDHGRLGRRKHAVTGDAGRLIERHPAWKTIKSTGVTEGRREAGDVVSVERRHSVSSLPADPKLLAYAARAHWGIRQRSPTKLARCRGNSLHHVLDAAFREDALKIRCGNSPENISVIRKMRKRRQLRCRSFRADPGEDGQDAEAEYAEAAEMPAWSEDYFEDLLFQAGNPLPTKTVPTEACF